MTATTADERLIGTGPVRRIVRRPEIGALIAAFAIFVFFTALTDTFATPAGASTWLQTSSTIGIMSVAIALLMIGGEFDLSAGVMTGFTGLVVGVLTTQLGLNIWVAVLVSLALAVGVGFVNGLLVMRTRLPSFIVTLGTYFVLQGIDLAGTKLMIGQVAIQGMKQVPFYDQARAVFGSTITIGDLALRGSVLWWLAVTVLATWVLLRARVGNWIFAVGGAAHSARQVGVPVERTKIGLFMVTSACGWLVGMLLLFQTSTVQAGTGVTQEFIYIICAVVGGCLMTGGYGSAVGAAFGALIYGMANQGIVYAGWDSNWLKAFLGVMLLAAVLLNEWVRRRAEEGRAR